MPANYRSDSNRLCRMKLSAKLGLLCGAAASRALAICRLFFFCTFLQLSHHRKGCLFYNLLQQSCVMLLTNTVECRFTGAGATFRKVLLLGCSEREIKWTIKVNSKQILAGAVQRFGEKVIAWINLTNNFSSSQKWISRQCRSTLLVSTSIVVFYY